MRFSNAVFLVAALISFSFISVNTIQADEKYKGKKILMIDSYHQGYPWSDGLANGARKAVKDSGAELKIIYLDTKNNPSEDFAVKAGAKAKSEIDEFKPDAIIACDDNASKHIIVPFLKDKSIPVVFCGVNWDASGYGFPCSNVTGMVEVSLLPQLIAQMKKFAKGDKVGYLAGDVETSRKEGYFYKNKFKLDLTEKYVKTFDEWKAAFLELQNSNDMLIIDSTAVKDWDKEKAVAFVAENTKIPTGSVLDFVAPYALISYTKIAEEQSEWSVRTVFQIFDGSSVSSIPVTQNKLAKVYINAKIAKKLGAVFDIGLMKQAEVIK